MTDPGRPRLATVSLAGCFGCHMSLLDIDERLVELAEIVRFDRCPLTDLKRLTARCELGLVEGGCGNDENVAVLRSFRRQCKVLVSVGDCATMGGVPALRNTVPLRECLDEAFLAGPSVHNPDGIVPDDVELPVLLDKVYPCHEVVRVDYHLPGCPPSAEVLWRAVRALLSDEPLEIPSELLRYD